MDTSALVEEVEGVLTKHLPSLDPNSVEKQKILGLVEMLAWETLPLR